MTSVSEPLIFEVKPNSLEGRKDVHYYHPKYLEVVEKLRSCPFELKLLKELVREPITDGDHEKREFSDVGVPYLRTVDIKEGQIFLKDTKKIPFEVHEKLKRSQIKSGDVLFSIMATIGTTAVVPDGFPECNANRTLAIIRLKKEINPNYLVAYFQTKLSKMLIERELKGAIQRRINLKDLESIKIPIPPLAIRNKISQILTTSQKIKNLKRSKAEELAEIDEPLLEKLGISIPTFVRTRTYWVKPEKIDKRRDPLFYHPNYQSIIEIIESKNFEIRRLGDISHIKSGQRPKGGVKYIKSGVPSLGGEHLTSDGYFNLEVLRFIPEQFHHDHIQSSIKPFDILMVKDGATTGKVSIVPKDFPFLECSINEHLFRIRLKPGYNPYYILYFLYSILGQKQIERLISGAAQKGIVKNAVAIIKIVVPQIFTQNEIAKKIKIRRDEVGRLRREANEIIKNSNDIIEKNILGTHTTLNH